MGVVHTTATTTVPDGDYCVDYSVNRNSEKCQHVQEQSSRTDWSDGLGSPGTITHYTCAFFRRALERQSSSPLVLHKCVYCIAQNGEGK